VISVGLSLGKTSVEEETQELFRRVGLATDENKIAEDLATLILSRTRRRYLKQQNPDGSSWEETDAAGIRLSGGFTFAKGGKYAPGGKKTGGNTLFSSGNLFQSILMENLGAGEFFIGSDVPYARYWMNDKYTIIGTTENEVDDFLKLIINRIL
jgi:phage gpG-like protein